MNEPQETASTPRPISPSEQIQEFLVIERSFSPFEDQLTVGLANIHAIVPGIEANKEKIVRACRIFKARGVNVAIFPEFSLSGYIWDDRKTCEPYVRQASIENHVDWVEQTLRPMLDETLRVVILNTFRGDGAGRYFNSTFVIGESNDWQGGSHVYDKVFLPSIERTYTRIGEHDRLDLESPWGRFGFTTCYDIMFSQLVQEYAFLDEVDGLIELASWRAAARRDYPGMNIGTDTYYGDLWDLTLASKAAVNQVWVIACNAVGTHGISGARFWGGSGLWAPSGLKLIQASRFNEELLIIHNVDIQGQRQLERDEFNYALDFGQVYRPIEGKRAFVRIRSEA